MVLTDEKKNDAAHADVPDSANASVEGADSTSIAFERRVAKIRRKVDLRLCLIIAVLYTVCQIDRKNLAYAVVAGMGKDIDLSGIHYSIIVMLFFPTYVIFQPPMTVIARKIGPRIFLSSICAAWGIVMMAFGFANEWEVIAGLRALLGLFESAFFPSCVFLISTWYVRHEVAVRISCFYLFGDVISGFGGVIAYGLQQMDGLGGYGGWRWIFIIEGIITVVVAVLGWFLIMDFPEQALENNKFLTTEEVEIMINRVDADRGDARIEKFSIWHYLENTLDWKAWILASNFGLTAIVVYSVAYFLPIVLREGLGFSIVQAQTLSAPCYVFGGILGFAQSWLSDRYKLRGPFIIFNCVIEIIGLGLLGFHLNNAVRYFGAFLVTGGGAASLPMALTYQANNIVGQWRRAFCSALTIGFGGIGGVVASLVFRDQDKPHYRPGLYACIISAALIIVSVSSTTIYFRHKNRLQRQGKAVIEGTEGFTYTL